MNRLRTAQRVAVVKALIDGASIRATVRMTGVAKNTVQKLILDLGAACAKYQDETLRGLTTRRVQCDEIWSFCYAKRKNVTAKIAQAHPDAGDVWTWTAIDADSKLVFAVAVGDRSAGMAHEFMQDAASRLKHRVQLTTDGLNVYLNAVEDAFGPQIDYATLTKIYGTDVENERRYSPPNCIGSIPARVTGDPDPKHISTSYVERHNLTMRMSMRRFTRLTNAFSRKIENHVAMTALYFMFYNFGRVHQTLRVTPAMEAGIARHAWSVEQIVGLLD